MSASLYDSNLWVALTFSAHPHHASAGATFASATDESPACFCRATQQSFLRLSTTPALLRAYRADGFTNRDAVDLHATLMRLSNVRILPEPPELESTWRQLAALPSASPKVWMDAYLAAFAIGHSMEFVTLDTDFKRFVKEGLNLKLIPSR